MKPPPPCLRHPEDQRTLGLLALLTACYMGAWWSPSALWLVPCIILALTACCAKHNHIHAPTFTRRRWNRVMDLWLTLLTGSTTTGIRVPHQVRHHGQNQSPEDFVRCHQVAGLPPLRALAGYVPRVVRESLRQGGADLRAGHRAGWLRCRRHEAAVLWLLIATGLAINPLRFLLVPGLPWVLSQWFLIAVNLPQHDGCDPDHPLAHSRNCTGPITNWLFLNNGYHTPHHEAPGWHWSRLPALHAQQRAAGLPRKLDCPSLAAFWVSWWRQRRREVAP